MTIVDRQNHHLFQPLLYQVATAGLSAPDIAQPIRAILKDCPRLTVLMDHVEEIRLAEKEVKLGKQTLHYDYLVMGLGGRTTYFGHPEWEPLTPGLKTLEDAVRIRRDILLAFEKAENAATHEELEELMTIVVVGGGPTGVELAGAFAELARRVLVKDFRHIDPSQARVILIEASSVVLNHLPDNLAASAQSQLQRLGVEVRPSTRVREAYFLDYAAAIHQLFCDDSSKQIVAMLLAECADAGRWAHSTLRWRHWPTSWSCSPNASTAPAWTPPHPSRRTN